MRESLKHTRAIKKRQEREERCRKAKGLILAQLYPKYSKDPLIRKIINTEVNEFMKTIKFPIQQNDLSQLEENIQMQLRPEYYYIILYSTLFAYKTGRLTFNSPRRMRLKGTWETKKPIAPSTSNRHSSMKHTPEIYDDADDEIENNLNQFAEDAKKTVDRVGTGEMDWTLLQSYYNMKEDEDDERRRRLDEERIKNTIHERDLQMKEIQQRKDQEVREKQLLHKSILSDYEKYKAEERERAYI